MLSMMHPSKISRTKKRLSNNAYYYVCITLGVVSLLWILLFVLRATSISWEHSAVRATIPQINLVDTSFRNSSNTVSGDSLMIALNDKGLYLGRVSDFSDRFYDSRTKRFFPNKNGRPMIHELITELSKIKDRKNHILLLVNDDWPASVMIHLIQVIRSHSRYEQVILGDNII